MAWCLTRTPGTLPGDVELRKGSILADVCTNIFLFAIVYLCTLDLLNLFGHPFIYPAASPIIFLIPSFSLRYMLPVHAQCTSIRNVVLVRMVISPDKFTTKILPLVIRTLFSWHVILAILSVCYILIAYTCGTWILINLYIHMLPIYVYDVRWCGTCSHVFKIPTVRALIVDRDAFMRNLGLQQYQWPFEISLKLIYLKISFVYNIHFDKQILQKKYRIWLPCYMQNDWKTFRQRETVDRADFQIGLSI